MSPERERIMKCECTGLKGVKLAQCIAPPKGDYSLEIEITDKLTLLITPEGLFLKQTVIQDDLPFTRTITRPVKEEFLNHVNLRIEKIKLPCLAARALIEAGNHGSRIAKEKLERCKELVEEILNQC